MECEDCGKRMMMVEVSIEGAQQKVKSYQCHTCDRVEFEPETSKKVVAELKSKEPPLHIKQKIVKLSADRVGIYFNRNIVESLGLKPGSDISLSVPDKRHIVMKLDP